MAGEEPESPRPGAQRGVHLPAPHRGPQGLSLLHVEAKGGGVLRHTAQREGGCMGM